MYKFSVKTKKAISYYGVEKAIEKIIIIDKDAICQYITITPRFVDGETVIMTAAPNSVFTHEHTVSLGKDFLDNFLKLIFNDKSGYDLGVTILKNKIIEKYRGESSNINTKQLNKE